MKKNGLVHIYYGKGKGKTTLSLGIALRAFGWGKKVIIFQFLKPKNIPSGEIKAIEKLGKNFKIVRFSKKHLLFDKKITEEELKKSIENSFREVERVVEKGRYDMVILDEILNVLKAGFLSEEKILNLIKKKPKYMELILTGRPLVSKLKDYADYISEIREIKHPFTRGIKARRGIEF